jgi:hypothetical protein
MWGWAHEGRRARSGPHRAVAPVQQPPGKHATGAGSAGEPEAAPSQTGRPAAQGTHLFVTLEDDWRLPMSFTESAPAPLLGHAAMVSAAAVLRTRSDVSVVSEKSDCNSRIVASSTAQLGPGSPAAEPGSPPCSPPWGPGRGAAGGAGAGGPAGGPGGAAEALEAATEKPQEGSLSSPHCASPPDVSSLTALVPAWPQPDTPASSVGTPVHAGRAAPAAGAAPGEARGAGGAAARRPTNERPGRKAAQGCVGCVVC